MCLARRPAPSKLTGVGGVGVPGSWYETILRESKNEEVWFGMDDCLGRTLRVLVAFYYLAITHPLSFFRFLVRYNMLWEGTASGLLVTVLFYPIYPFAALFLLLVKQALLPPRAYEAVRPPIRAPLARPPHQAPPHTAGLARLPTKRGTTPTTGLVTRRCCAPACVRVQNNVFFNPPKGAVAAAVWNWYKALSPPVAQFMFNRGDTAAIAHSWWDHVTHKDFWRTHLSRVGARVPKVLCSLHARCMHAACTLHARCMHAACMA